MIEVGQKLWYVEWQGQRFKPESERGREITITKVGRKWAESTHAPRIDKKTMRADGRGYTSPGKAYESRDDYLQSIRLSDMWSKLYRAVREMHSRPEWAGEVEIAEIARRLRIEIRTE